MLPTKKLKVRSRLFRLSSWNERPELSIRAAIEPLEPRTLLSAGGTLDPSFGSGGVLSNEAPVSVRIDGTMVADPDAGDLAVLNPDGSFDAAFTPPVSRGPTSGKSLRLSGGSISRVNADGTPDTTFGNGGTVSDLTSGTTVTSFSPQALFSVGDQLLVAGSATTSGSSDNFIAIERLNNDGSIDRTFGAQGIALSASGSSGSVNVAFIRTDVPTGNILIAGQLNGNPGVAKFGPAGQVLGQFFTATASDPHVYGLSVQNDEKTVVLIGADNKSFSLYRVNVDMSIDTSFGTNGSVTIAAPDSPSTVTRAYPGSLNIRPDGLIIVGASFDYSDRAHASFTFAFSPGVPDGSASVSGDLYSDTGSTTTTTTTAAISRAANNPNTVALPYWQVYADLNNNDHFDWGEPTAYADSNGHYNLDGLAPGKYHIREVQRPGFVSNTTDPGSFDVTLSREGTKTGQVQYRPIRNWTCPVFPVVIGPVPFSRFSRSRNWTCPVFPFRTCPVFPVPDLSRFPRSAFPIARVTRAHPLTLSSLHRLSSCRHSTSDTRLEVSLLFGRADRCA